MPKWAFCHLQTELAEREEALRVATIKASTLQALLETDRQSFTSNPTMERELIHLRHSHNRLREVARDLGFDVSGLLHTHARMTRSSSLVLGGYVKPCPFVSAMFDLLTLFSV